MKNLWIAFEDNVPECSKHEEDDLLLLAESLLHFDGTVEEEDHLLHELLTLPLGIMKTIQGKRVVKVQE